MKIRTDFVTNSSSSSFVFEIGFVLNDDSAISYSEIGEDGEGDPIVGEINVFKSPKQLGTCKTIKEMVGVLKESVADQWEYDDEDATSLFDDHHPSTQNVLSGRELEKYKKDKSLAPFFMRRQKAYKKAQSFVEEVSNISSMDDIKSIWITGDERNYVRFYRKYVYNLQTKRYTAYIEGGFIETNGGSGGDLMFDDTDEAINVVDIDEEIYGPYVSEQTDTASMEVNNSSMEIKNDVLVQFKGKETEVIIPDGVMSIGDCAFEDCKDIVSITIPNSVTSIGDYAFGGCKRLASITIPDSVTSIGECVFHDTKWLENKRKENPIVVVNEKLVDGVNCKGKVVIPDGVTSIGDSAFEECSFLTSITIPQSVISIGISAFQGCGLKSVTIPDSVMSIGDSAFEGCSFLKSVTIPDGVKSIGSGTFIDCEDLNNIIIPDGVTSIGDSAFEGCSSLKSITIPDSVTRIGDSAFDGCSSLTSITIPDSVMSIGNSVFSGCSSLKSIAIPDGVTSIGNFAFSGCSSLKSITIPDSTTSIGDSAFEDCSSLKSVTIPDGVKSIGKEAFMFCENLTSITIPEGVTSIGEDAFADTKWLEDNEEKTENNVKTSSKSVAASSSSIKKYSWMAGKIFVHTGLSLEEEQVFDQIVKDNGGEVKSSTVIGTDYLVYNADYGHETTKLRRARELQARGSNICIITFDEWNKLLKSESSIEGHSNNDEDESDD